MGGLIEDISSPLANSLYWSTKKGNPYRAHRCPSWRLIDDIFQEVMRV